MSALSDWLQKIWYGREPPPGALLPLERVYAGIAARQAARARAHAEALPVPVIVVGNLTAGGAGKTPFVLWLVQMLRARGLRPGVISRGYGGHSTHYPLLVTPATEALRSGDEPALIARRLGVPVAVAPDRVAAARLLIERGEVDVLIADDGLQHYRLARSFEVCVIDGARGLGNGHRLPAGPLRETCERLASVDLVVFNGPLRTALPLPDGGQCQLSAAGGPASVTMRLEIREAVNLADCRRQPLSAFVGKPLHAIAGIGHPARFFEALHAQRLSVLAHPFPDHHRYSAADLQFDDDLSVLMTEKDAVKCAEFAGADHWQVPAEACLDDREAALVQKLLLERLGSKLPAHG